ncbi:VOC family protein [Actinoplanes sp. NPDC049265]|uniref:VOC family protein n=1 Tax=Actinoplanes sp. NPDC049265 TaxID=3363902 RepID=UPI0037205765
MDLGTSDVDGAKRFYTGLFGWTAHVSGDDYGGYTIFNLDGKAAAGAGPLFGEGQPTAWSTYISTDDVDETAMLVEEAGGKVLVPPFDVGVQGRMAACLDPAGAPFSVWQAGTMAGAEVLDVPGALTWSELITRDVERSAAFYGEVFGWTARDSPAVGMPYLIWERDGRMLGGLQPMVGAGWPADLAAHWMPYFAVRHCDEAADLAHELGGHIVRRPTNFAMGRYAVIDDPEGGTFSIMESA